MVKRKFAQPSKSICATQLAVGALLIKVKYFEGMLNILISRVCKKL